MLVGFESTDMGDVGVVVAEGIEAIDVPYFAKVAILHGIDSG
jgi:hypothetical protein